MSKADRFIVLEVHPDDLLEKIEHARSLRLKFLVMGDDMSSVKVNLVIFFDTAAMNNYLAGRYTLFADEIRLARATCGDDASLGERIREIMREHDLD